MPASRSVIESLVTDFRAESDELVRILEAVPTDGWAMPTPAEGWTVQDQVAHLAFFDHATRLAVEDPDAFIDVREEIEDLQAYVDAVGADNAWRGADGTLTWWHEENARLRSAFLAADPSVRIPWFGPPMSIASKVTARIMETWAHGQDVADALGVRREPTARLQHVARIGVLTVANSFRARHREPPTDEIRVELTAPDGSQWAWGPEDGDDVVRGSAEDFCLLVTQRRHVDDTALEVVGPIAQAWAPIAQAFAGPPGAGRQPSSAGLRG